MSKGRAQSEPGSNEAFEWDVFISHASEDKESLVRPLATMLTRLGLRVWYDEFALQPGDSLLESIDNGLSRSAIGLVIISRTFMAKPWPKRELKGLTTLAMAKPGRRVIPVWHEVSHDEILEFSPPLA